MRVEPSISDGSLDLCLNRPLAVDFVTDYINISVGRIRYILPFSGSDIVIHIDVSLNLDKNHFPRPSIQGNQIRNKNTPIRKLNIGSLLEDLVSAHFNQGFTRLNIENRMLRRFMFANQALIFVFEGKFTG